MLYFKKQHFQLIVYLQKTQPQESIRIKFRYKIMSQFNSNQEIANNSQQQTLSRSLGQNDHIEIINQNANKQIEQQEEQIHVKQLKGKILFACQSLGTVTLINNLMTYVKGKHCEQSLKDLVKYLRSDKPSKPFAKIILSDFQIVESDLLQLLILHVQDKKLSFWLIILLALLTQKPHEDLPKLQSDKINKSLLQYKIAFIKHQCFTIIMLHIAQFLKTKPQQRFLAHKQMVEFSLIVVRNLLQVKQSDTNQAVHQRFIINMVKEQFFNPILYLIQAKNIPEILQKIDIVLMQICYHIFTCISPKSIYSSKKDSNFSFKTIATKIQNSYSKTGRHSRFQPVFKVKNLSTSSERISHKIEERHNNSFKGQRKILCRCLCFSITQMKIKNVKQSIAFLSIQNNFFNRIFPLFQQKSQKIKDQDVLEYFLLCNWAVLMTNEKYHYEIKESKTNIERSKVQYDLSQIVCLMQGKQFQYLYKILYTQATKPLKRHFKYKLFHPALVLFQTYLNAIQNMQSSYSMSDRKNAVTLMGYMFKHQISKVLKLAFNYVIEQSMIKKIIIVTYQFFILLESYAQGRAITVTTNRQLRNRPKRETKVIFEKVTLSQEFPKTPEELMQNTLEHQANIEEQKNIQPKSQPKKKHAQIMDQQQFQLRFQQRKVNLLSELASLSSYQILQIYLRFLKPPYFDPTQHQLNISIFYHFQKIITLLKGEWIFFQASTICLFYEHLSNKQLKSSYKQIMRYICKSFLQLIQSNPLALAESLFRFPSISVKDQIFKNYEDSKQPIKFNGLKLQQPINNGLTQIFPFSQNTFNTFSQSFIMSKMPIFGDSQFLGSLQMGQLNSQVFDR